MPGSVPRADVPLPAPAARGRPGRTSSHDRAAAPTTDRGGDGFLRSHRFRPVRVPHHRRSSGHPSRAAAPARGGRAPLATGPARPAGARGCRRRRAPGRGVDRGPVQRSPQAAGPRQPDRTDERAGHDHGDHGRGRPRSSGPRQCVRHRLLRRRWRRRAAHRGERPRRRVPGRAGGRLGGRDGAGPPGRSACGDRADRHRPVRTRGAPSSSSVRSSPPASEDHSPPGRSGCRGSASTTWSTSSVGRSSTSAWWDPSTRSRPIRCATASTPRHWPASCGARALIPVPALGPRLLLGAEGAREMVQASQRVTPQRLRASGHTFRHPTLEACLRHQLGHLDPLPGPGESAPGEEERSAS